MAQGNTSEEIDLGLLLKKSNDFFKSVVRAFFLILEFFKRYFIILIVLLLIGFGYGYYKDSNELTVYNNEVIIIPNYESVDYLYSRVEAINNKIASNDTLYLQQILDTNFRKLKSIELEPIVDLYNFVSKTGRNYDVLKLISEKRNISEYMTDYSISKYYKYHRLKFSIAGRESSQKIIADLLSYLNKNKHYEEYQEVYKENNKLKIQEYYAMISQIDSVLKANSRINAAGSNVSITNSTDLFDLIDRKRQLLDFILEVKTQEMDFVAPIKIVSADYNLTQKKLLNLSNKIKYPIWLVFLFSLVFFILYLLRGLRKYAKSDDVE